MVNSVNIKKKIKKFNKTIFVNGDKSISIRWVLFSSLSDGVSKAKNLLISDDVIAAVKAIKSLGIKDGDEVITVANTAIPTISAIRGIGAIPKLVDIGEDYLIDTSKIERETPLAFVTIILSLCASAFIF